MNRLKPTRTVLGSFSQFPDILEPSFSFSAALRKKAFGKAIPVIVKKLQVKGVDINKLLDPGRLFDQLLERANDVKEVQRKESDDMDKEVQRKESDDMDKVFKGRERTVFDLEEDDLARGLDLNKYLMSLDIIEAKLRDIMEQRKLTTSEQYLLLNVRKIREDRYKGFQADLREVLQKDLFDLSAIEERRLDIIDFVEMSRLTKLITKQENLPQAWESNEEYMERIMQDKDKREALYIILKLNEERRK